MTHNIHSLIIFTCMYFCSHLLSFNHERTHVPIYYRHIHTSRGSQSCINTEHAYAHICTLQGHMLTYIHMHQCRDSHTHAYTSSPCSNMLLLCLHACKWCIFEHFCFCPLVHFVCVCESPLNGTYVFTYVLSSALRLSAPQTHQVPRQVGESWLRFDSTDVNLYVN